MTAKILQLVFVVELFDATAHILFKKSVNRFDPDRLRSVKAYATFFRKILRIPAIWGGFGLITGGLFVWFIVLAQADLSVAFPFCSIRYLLIMVASRLFLGEQFDRRRITGTLCIVAGIVCVAFS